MRTDVVNFRRFPHLHKPAHAGDKQLCLPLSDISCLIVWWVEFSRVNTLRQNCVICRTWTWLPCAGYLWMLHMGLFDLQKEVQMENCNPVDFNKRSLWREPLAESKISGCNDFLWGLCFKFILLFDCWFMTCQN